MESSFPTITAFYKSEDTYHNLAPHVSRTLQEMGKDEIDNALKMIQKKMKMEYKLRPLKHIRQFFDKKEDLSYIETCGAYLWALDETKGTPIAVKVRALPNSEINQGRGCLGEKEVSSTLGVTTAEKDEDISVVGLFVWPTNPILVDDDDDSGGGGDDEGEGSSFPWKWVIIGASVLGMILLIGLGIFIAYRINKQN